MKSLKQKHIDELDLLARRFSCEFCLPPSKLGSHPFLHVAYIKDMPNVIFDLNITLIEMGYSFIASDKNNIEIIGVTDDELYRLSNFGSFYGNLS